MKLSKRMGLTLALSGPLLVGGVMGATLLIPNINAPMVMAATTPTIMAPGQHLVMGEAVDLLAGVTATDSDGIDLTASVEVIDYGGLDSGQPGEYWVTYSVTDVTGQTTTTEALFVRTAETVVRTVEVTIDGHFVQNYKLTGTIDETNDILHKVTTEYRDQGYTLQKTDIPVSGLIFAGQQSQYQISLVTSTTENESTTPPKQMPRKATPKKLTNTEQTSSTGGTTGIKLTPQTNQVSEQLIQLRSSARPQVVINPTLLPIKQLRHRDRGGTSTTAWSAWVGALSGELLIGTH